ncbi:SDR family NAD(P)-dependent oxidoreductase [Paucibacter sp. PLA-PC-4]|uniref:SDR family NAD(P)-dependent oxidoreductase n=1 Tax=Paucibacter sp. PLA-PC-4 TaxID=2993655 RepID=UPI00224B8941|nr:SDR family NAD(P)-dependent oxidoreductase [Paucibacter sp. PLA-PC-4]MCX2865776.1 SDR family NAD(P)-dependent oxidoreductase [Paucibacter sp. PLA-PC-4]
MNLEYQAAVVTGAGSGLGEAVARALARAGARVALLDINLDAATRVAADMRQQGGHALALRCDISDADSATAALDEAAAAHGPTRVLMNIAGVGGAKRIIQRDGSAAPLDDFERTLRINLLGTYNMVRLMAARAALLEPMEDGERGVIVNTASVAAFDGQVGQEAYAASKAGIAGMTLPLARDLAQWGIRVCTIAPGIFATPLLKELPQVVQQSLADAIPFPKRLGHPDEFAALALHIASNGHLNGEVIRLDGALRLAPR